MRATANNSKYAFPFLSSKNLSLFISLGHVVPPRPVPSFASLPLGFLTPHYFVTILLLFSYDLVIILLLFHFYFTTSIYPRVQRAQSQRASESSRELLRASRELQRASREFQRASRELLKSFQRVPSQEGAWSLCGCLLLGQQLTKNHRQVCAV